MASNDINSWDENPDESVRRNWQQAFADFELQPRPSLTKRIFRLLPTSSPYASRRWITGASVLILLSIGVSHQIGFEGKSLLASERKGVPAHTSARLTPDSPIRLASVESEQLALSESVTSKHVPWRPARVREKHTPTKSLPFERIRLTDADLVPPTKPFEQATSPQREVNSNSRLIEKMRVGQSGLSPQSTQVALPPPVSEPASIEGQASRLEMLRAVAGKPLAHGLHMPSIQVPVENTTPMEPIKITARRVPKVWFVELMPQSSFQRMHASLATTEYLLPGLIPQAFAPNTWGYQIRGGIRFRYWQAHVSLGHLRRWANYTVYENRFRVEPSPTNPHELVRESYVVTENRLLPMIGAGLSRHQSLREGRYTVELGGQVMYFPTSGQTLLGLRGRAGRRLLTTARHEYSLGLSLEYGLNPLLNEPKQLAIRPLVVGVGLQLQPRLGNKK